jgi:branched-chain amino acid transport system ATP-binding protein
MTMEHLLELKAAHVHYGGVRALDGADMMIDDGEMVALMGPNGAGKSTVLKAIFGLAPMASGSLLWHGSAVKPVSYEMVERGVSFVPQGRRVFMHLTIEENLEMGGITVRDKKELKRRIGEAMDIFPVLRHKRKRKSGQLSGGEQQMVALARGIVTDPKVLLLDEPSLGLAPKIVKEVFQKIREINERHKTAIVVVEHNIKSLLEIVHRAYILDKGRVIQEGDPATLLKSGILEKVFLGKLE